MLALRNHSLRGRMNSEDILNQLTIRMGGLDRCFEKHNFQELNNIDFETLYKAFLFFLHKYNYSGGAIFDVGCNAGSFIKVLQVFGLTQNIHCFEPHPVISKKTKETYPYISMNEMCLSNKNGTVEIFIPMWSVGLSSIINRPVFQKLEQDIYRLHVPSKTLDSYCSEHNIPQIDFIKIDVEGAEKMVLEGAKTLLENKKIRCGLFEVGTTLTDANTSEHEIIQLLESYGYVVDRTFTQDNYLFYLP